MLYIIARPCCHHDGDGGRSLSPGGLLLYGIIFLLFTGALSAQQISESCVGGRSYLITFPGTVQIESGDQGSVNHPSESAALHIYSSVTQDVRVQGSNWSETLRIRGGEVAEFELLDPDRTSPLIHTPGLPDRSPVVRVDADDPVVVYALLSTRSGSAGFTPIPVETWGMEHYAATWPGLMIGATGAPAQIAIIAAHDDTEVLIKPTAALESCQECTSVHLNRGEAYLLRSAPPASGDPGVQSDLAGSMIQSTRPIGVVSGNTQTNIDTSESQGEGASYDMTAEWLRPLEEHGTRFVFVPTGEDGGRMEKLHVARMFATLERHTEFEASHLDGNFDNLRVKLAPMQSVIWTPPARQTGHAIRSDDPAQVFLGIPFDREPDSTAEHGLAAYHTRGSAMAELIPQNRWVDFAPFRTPSDSGYSSYLTLVADTANIGSILLKKDNGTGVPLVFDRTIRGTRFAWTQMKVEGNQGYILSGTDGATFTGQVYGSTGGYEAGQSDRTRDVSPRAYAYPLVSRTCLLEKPKEYIIDTVSIECNFITLRIRTTDGSPLNLQYIRSVHGFSFNMLLRILKPTDRTDIDRVTEAHVQLGRHRSEEPGEAMMEFREIGEGSKPWRHAHEFGVDVIYLTPAPLSLEVESDEEGVEREVVLRNETVGQIYLRDIALASGSNGFSVTRTEPDVDWSRRILLLEPGDSITLWIRYDPAGPPRSSDTLIAEHECGILRIPLQAVSTVPCLMIGDLDFGSLNLGESRTRELEICNLGGGLLTFDSLPLLWDFPAFFSISEEDLQRLRNTELASGECVTIDVTFSSGEVVGDFRSIARLQASTRNCRDTSVWSANVGISSISGSTEIDGYRFGSLTPNPTGGEARLSYEIPQSGLTTITLVDATGREVGVLYEDIEEAGPRQHVLDLDRLPSGLYFVQVRSGAWEWIEVVHVVR